MGKSKPTTNTDPVEAKIKEVSILAARQRFLSATFGMGWRLAVTVVIPIVAGVKLDEHFNTSPSLTLLGMMLAAVAGSITVWDSVKRVDKESEEEMAKTKRKGKNA